MTLEIDAERERHACEMELLALELEACGSSDGHFAAAATEHAAQLSLAAEAHAAEAAHAPSLRAALTELANRAAAEQRRHALVANRCKAEVAAATREVGPSS